MKTRQTGVAIIELALVLPLLLILALATTELGRALYQYNTLAKSVRDGARYLSTQDPSIATTDPAKISIAKNLVVYGIPKASVSGIPPLAIGLDPSLNVPTPTWQISGTGPAINTVTIRVTDYTFHPIWSSVFGVAFGDITFSEIAATMRAQL